MHGVMPMFVGRFSFAAFGVFTFTVVIVLAESPEAMTDAFNVVLVCTSFQKNPSPVCNDAEDVWVCVNAPVAPTDPPPEGEVFIVLLNVPSALPLPDIFVLLFAVAVICRAASCSIVPGILLTLSTPRRK